MQLGRFLPNKSKSGFNETVAIFETDLSYFSVNLGVSFVDVHHTEYQLTSVHGTKPHMHSAVLSYTI